ncbi:HutD family protein [Arthrobacter sp.]|uniref:HutD/Ves family protein n=1 Tax=Arthrobacter sp. TaxID=1667 RepID=UPI0026E03780|nr:HutD family protein [Arthrobacter sp.]MDO5752538.1 HutD family protein [Arthrobacter sp.]
MEIIRHASLKAVPWAGGTTRQIAVGPDGAGGWDWRLSLADVVKAGPFSPMPGIDRIITVVEGELIALTVDGVEQALEKYRPFRFSGDSETSATLPTGILKDLNLMTRRGVCKGYAMIVELSKKRPHPVFAGQFAVLLQGSASVSPASPDTDDAAASSVPPTETLGKFDTVVGAEEAPEISGRGFLAVLSIDPARESSDPDPGLQENLGQNDPT